MTKGRVIIIFFLVFFYKHLFLFVFFINMGLSVSLLTVLIDPSMFFPPSWYLSDAVSPHSVMCHGSGAEQCVVGTGGGRGGLTGGSWRQRDCGVGERTSAPGRHPQHPHCGAAGLSAGAPLCQLPGVRAPSCQMSRMHVRKEEFGCSDYWSTIDALIQQLLLKDAIRCSKHMLSSSWYN